MMPVAGFPKEILACVCLLELDFQKVHVGVVKELQVPFSRRRSGLIAISKVEEKRGGRVIRGGLRS